MIAAAGEEQTNQNIRQAKRGAARSDRIDLRIAPTVKQRWQRAADVLGIPLASFVTMAAMERADQTIREQESLVLSAEDSAWFVNLLMQPAREPNAALLRAAERHRELFGE